METFRFQGNSRGNPIYFIRPHDQTPRDSITLLLGQQLQAVSLALGGYNPNRGRKIHFKSDHPSAVKLEGIDHPKNPYDLWSYVRGKNGSQYCYLFGDDLRMDIFDEDGLQCEISRLLNHSVLVTTRDTLACVYKTLAAARTADPYIAAIRRTTLALVDVNFEQICRDVLRAEIHNKVAYVIG